MAPIQILVGIFTVNKQVVDIVTRLEVKHNVEALQQGVRSYCHLLVKLRNTHSGMKSSWRGWGMVVGDGGRGWGGVLRGRSGPKREVTGRPGHKC